MRLLKAVLTGTALTAGILSIPVIVGFLVAIFVPVGLFLVITFIVYVGLTGPPEAQDEDPKKPP